jgi:hypothetical protein
MPPILVRPTWILACFAVAASAWLGVGRAFPAAPSYPAGAHSIRLLGDFSAEWADVWHHQGLFSRKTHYEVVEDDGNRVLQAVSRNANSGLARRLEVDAPTHLTLSWRWKIASALLANRREQSRRGDDFAARVMVVFESSPLPWRNKVVNYVWAAHAPQGEVFSNPFSSSVAVIVLRSGDGDAGMWRHEHRDVLQDYRAYFGGPPSRISAVALLVDTDNTGLSATAWFDDLDVAVSPAPES